MKALIDTGCHRTVFPRGAGEALGLEFPPARESAGLTKHFLGGTSCFAISRLVTLRLVEGFADLSWEAEVDFLIEDDVLPFGLLGSEGFLNKWVVSFNYYGNYFVVEPIEDFERRVPLDEFEELQRRYPDAYQP